MNTLFVAWQAPRSSRAWFPIGRLDAEDHHFVFRYTGGAIKARQQAGFDALIAFPDLNRKYEAVDLFPLFKNRILDSNRKDFAEYLGWLDLDPRQADPIEILSLTGGERETDSLEVFPKLEKRADGSICSRFFLHGLRHVAPEAQARARRLMAGEKLQVAIEVNNPATGLAIQIQTGDGHLIGWAPRYLIEDLSPGLLEPSAVQAEVRRINEFGAPFARRVLIELRCGLPSSFEPMTSSDYAVLTS
jgi:hypothetical protein